MASKSRSNLSKTPNKTPPVTPNRTPPATPNRTPPATPNRTSPATANNAPPATASKASPATPNKALTATPRVSKLSKGLSKSELESSPPLQNLRLSVEKSQRSLNSKSTESPGPLSSKPTASPHSLNSKPTASPLSSNSKLAERSPWSLTSKLPVERKSPGPISTLPDEQLPRAAKGSELKTQLSLAQEDLKKAKEQLIQVEEEKAKAIEELEEAQKVADEANEKLEEALMAQKRAEEDIEIEKFRSVELERAGTEAAQKKEEEWQKELESVRSQHALDVSALLSATQELQRIKQELAMACDAKNKARSQADYSTKAAGIHAAKAEILSSEVTRLKALLDSKLEMEASEKKNVLELQKEIEALKQELEKAKGFEKKVTEKEAYIKQLNVELEAAKLAESYAHSMLEDWKKKVEELEVRVEEANKLERFASASLESVMKQLKGSNDLLHDAESEISSLKEKVGLLEMTIGTQRGDFEDSERRLLVTEKESLEMSKKVDSLQSELETVKEEKAQALGNEKLAASSVQTLLEEKSKLLHELEASRDEKDKSRKAMEILASALHEVSTEARDAKEMVLANHADRESYEAQIKDLKLVLKATNEKYESMLNEARDEIDLLTSGIDNSKDIIENSKEQWEQRELHLVSCLKQTEEENSSLGKEVNRLISLLRETEEEVSAKMGGKSQLKEVNAEVIHLQEAIKEAKAECMKLKENLLDKENEFQNIFQENEELRSRELISNKKVEELSKLLEEATIRNQTKLENGDLIDSEKNHDLLPKVVEFSEENGHGGEKISKAKLLASAEEERPKESSEEESVALTDDKSEKDETPKPENVSGKLNEVNGRKGKDDKVEVEFKILEKSTIEKKEYSDKEVVESKNGGEGFDKINGDGASVTEKENIDEGVLRSSSKKQEQQLMKKKKKKKTFFGMFGRLLKRKSNSK
ncbi:putative WEB family protein [Lupinus albus]|uniref:Putative WEB family protein n=1 Tax=Lupinus albus TaxID=3870 RepID=A0A6A4PYE2_LUPAL|nr:putative WEB family protein [Lupinus albus]